MSHRGPWAGLYKGQFDDELDPDSLSHVEFCVYGTALALVRDDETAAAQEDGRHLQAWHFDSDASVDRYDVRLLLNDPLSAVAVSRSLTDAEEQLEKELDAERYFDLDPARAHPLEHPLQVAQFVGESTGSGTGRSSTLICHAWSWLPLLAEARWFYRTLQHAVQIKGHHEAATRSKLVKPGQGGSWVGIFQTYR